MFHNNTVEILEILHMYTSWKHAWKLPTLLIFAYFVAVFYSRKNQNILFFFKPMRI